MSNRVKHALHALYDAYQRDPYQPVDVDEVGLDRNHLYPLLKRRLARPVGDGTDLWRITLAGKLYVEMGYEPKGAPDPNERVLRAVRAHPGLSARQLREHVTLGRRIVDRELRHLADARRIDARRDHPKAQVARHYPREAA